MQGNLFFIISILINADDRLNMSFLEKLINKNIGDISFYRKALEIAYGAKCRNMPRRIMQISVDFCTPSAEYLCPTSKLRVFSRTLNRGHLVVKTSARNEALPRPRQIGVARGRHDGHDYSLPEIPL